MFVDSSHFYDHTLAEIKVFLPFISRRGYLVFHDYFDPKLGVRQAVDEFFGNYDEREFVVCNFLNRFLIIKLN